MILRLRYIILMNGWVLQFGAKWPSPDGKDALIEDDDPKNPGQKKKFLMPARIGPMFFVKGESESEDYADGASSQGENAFYEVWAAPENEEATKLLGGEIRPSGKSTRRLRIPESGVLLAEEVWPWQAAKEVCERRMKDILLDYEELIKPEPEKEPKQVETPASNGG